LEKLNLKVGGVFKMSDEIPAKTPQAVTPLSSGPSKQVKPLDLNQFDMRKQMSNAMKNMVETINQLRKENAQLKVQLAEAQKKP
jgi:hypothetical protein